MYKNSKIVIDIRYHKDNYSLKLMHRSAKSQTPPNAVDSL